jgi:hypothetical protein
VSSEIGIGSMFFFWFKIEKLVIDKSLIKEESCLEIEMLEELSS